MSNGNIGVLYGLEGDLSTYDKLPKPVRDLLKDSIRNVTAENVMLIKRRYSLDNAELLEEIAQRFEGFHDQWIQEDWQGLKGEHPGLNKFKT